MSILSRLFKREPKPPAVYDLGEVTITLTLGDEWYEFVTVRGYAERRLVAGRFHVAELHDATVVARRIINGLGAIEADCGDWVPRHRIRWYNMSERKPFNVTVGERDVRYVQS